MGRVTLPVRVKPGASRNRVLGAFGGTCDEPPALVVAVTAPPVDGRANDAVVRAVADALGLRPRQVQIVAGHTSRNKTVALDLPDEDESRAQARIAELLSAQASDRS